MEAFGTIVVFVARFFRRIVVVVEIYFSVLAWRDILVFSKDAFQRPEEVRS